MTDRCARDLAYSKELVAAVTAARSAGDFLRTSLGSVSFHDIVYKGEIDIVTFYDLEAQRLVVESLTQACPEYAFLTEEKLTDIAESASGKRWIIDPLDGTSNYAHGFPHFCISLALEISDRIDMAVVYAPMLDELFTAVRGGGAFLNGAPIRVSSTSRLIDSIIATGFPYDKVNNLGDCLTLLARAAPAVRSPRVLGAAALDLCYLACGRLDSYLDVELAPWDMAAGAMIVAEAGGQVTDVRGAPFMHLGQTILASNGSLHSAILNTLWGRED